MLEWTVLKMSHFGVHSLNIYTMITHPKLSLLWIPNLLLMNLNQLNFNPLTSNPVATEAVAQDRIANLAIQTRKRAYKRNNPSK